MSAPSSRPKVILLFPAVRLLAYIFDPDHLSRWIVFLLATNYLSEFDSAFTRDGRFDMRAC
jgi:hypothetical protein